MGSRRPPRHIRIFLASPGDVVDERRAVRGVAERLERSPLIRDDFTIQVVSWDDPDAPVPMLAMLTPQQAVSRALPRPSECDFTIVIVAQRMGTPLDERKPDGSPYRSGTEWEFEDARRAGKPILLYRRTTPAASPGTDAEEIARQRRSVDEFFSQFTNASGALTGGVTSYAAVDELVSRLRTDIETLLLSLRASAPGPGVPPEAGWTGRIRANIQRWHFARLLLLLGLGSILTIVAWTAFSAFSTVIEEYDPPRFAFLVRYALLALGLLVPVILVAVTWLWLGRDKVSDV
jgi:hypothetical protein